MASVMETGASFVPGATIPAANSNVVSAPRPSPPARVTMAAVSYTHLDVYKRQPYFSPNKPVTPAARASSSDVS